MRISDWSSDVCSSDLHGSDEFKKAVYLEAARSGVEVKGFKPSEQLKLEGERLAARDKAREAQDPAKRASMAKQDPSESRAAAEQFRRNSHRDNAANPQFKAAQDRKSTRLNSSH